MTKTEISAMLRPLVEELGCEFVGMEIVKEAGSQVLRLYIDREGGITLEDCEKISQKAGLLLDDIADSFEKSYLLEVSSPGIERPLFDLADYERFAGKAAEIKTKEPLEGRRRFSVVIDGVRENEVLAHCGETAIAVPFDAIASAHLVYVEEKGQKKTFRKKGGKK